MLRKNMWIGLVFLVVFLPTVVWSQGMMHGRWWYDKAIIQDLELTGGEKKELDEKYVASRRKMIDLKGEIEKQRFELDLLLGTEGADKQKIMERFESLEEARAALSRTRFDMLMEIRDIIGAERFQDLEIRHRERYGKNMESSRRERSSRRKNRRD